MVVIPPVATLKAGTCFGETAILSNSKETRNAWIRAKKDMDVYVLSGVDFREALRCVPEIRALFEQKTSVDKTDREDHIRAFHDGGGNFKKGFRVKLKNTNTQADVHREIKHTLESAFEQVPESFPKHAVETLLHSKIEEIQDLKDKLSSDPNHDHNEVENMVRNTEASSCTRLLFLLGACS